MKKFSDTVHKVLGLKTMHSSRFKLIASSYLLLLRDKKILLLRRYNTGYEDGKYSVPAGHLDEEETLRMCHVREAKEEIGITISEENIKLVHVMHRKEKDIRIDFFFTAISIKGEPVNCESDKCDELKWFPINNLPSNTIPYIRQAIENYFKGTFYSEIGWSET